MEHTIYDTRTLLQVGGTIEQNAAPVTTYWLDLLFNEEMNFDTEYVDFGLIDEKRVLAPLVVPTAQGKPIYSAAERSMRLKPAYVKPKDPVSAARMLRRQAGLGELAPREAMTPAARYNAIIADITRVHRNAIRRRWEWMAARAAIDGRVTLNGDTGGEGSGSYPTTVVDFQRHPDNTMVLAPGSRWGDAGVSIVESINDIREQVRRMPYGGPLNRITIGGDVFRVLRQDPEIVEQLNLNFRQFQTTSLNRGFTTGKYVEYVGNLGGDLEVYVYSDFYEDLYTGEVIDVMARNEVVFSGPNVRGVRAFGAILDKGAQFQPLSIFPKMWDEQDPSVTYVMHQSAPLMVPVRPNNTFKLTPVALQG